MSQDNFKLSTVTITLKEIFIWWLTIDETLKLEWHKKFKLLGFVL